MMSRESGRSLAELRACADHYADLVARGGCGGDVDAQRRLLSYYHAEIEHRLSLSPLCRVAAELPDRLKNPLDGRAPGSRRATLAP